MDRRRFLTAAGSVPLAAGLPLGLASPNALAVQPSPDGRFRVLIGNVVYVVSAKWLVTALVASFGKLSDTWQAIAVNQDPRLYAPGYGFSPGPWVHLFWDSEGGAIYRPGAGPYDVESPPLRLLMEVQGRPAEEVFDRYGAWNNAFDSWLSMGGVLLGGIAPAPQPLNSTLSAWQIGCGVVAGGAANYLVSSMKEALAVYTANRYGYTKDFAKATLMPLYVAISFINGVWGAGALAKFIAWSAKRVALGEHPGSRSAVGVAAASPELILDTDVPLRGVTASATTREDYSLYYDFHGGADTAFRWMARWYSEDFVGVYDEYGNLTGSYNYMDDFMVDFYSKMRTFLKNVSTNETCVYTGQGPASRVNWWTPVSSSTGLPTKYIYSKHFARRLYMRFDNTSGGATGIAQLQPAPFDSWRTANYAFDCGARIYVTKSSLTTSTAPKSGLLRIQPGRSEQFLGPAGHC